MPEYYSDYDGNFTRQNDGDVQKDIDVDAIFNSIGNIVLTTQGERRMLPTFASNIKRLLFEPIDETTANHPDTPQSRDARPTQIILGQHS